MSASVPTKLVRSLVAAVLLLGVTHAMAAGTFVFRLASPGVRPSTPYSLASVSAGSLDFGSVPVGSTSAVKSVQLSNNGTAALTIASITPSGAYAVNSDCGTSLASGGKCTFNLTFSPTNINANPGSLVVKDDSGIQTVTLAGIGLQAFLGASPTTLAFGTLAVGQSSTSQSFSVVNTGNMAASGLSVSAPSGYSQTNNCGSSLAAGASCSVSVTFSPAAQQTYSGTVQVTGAGVSAAASVSGAGGAASFVPATGSITLPSAGPNTTSSASLSITNNGTVAGTPTISATTGFSATGCGSLAPGASCTSTLTFAPTVQQVYSGTLTISGATSPTRTVALSGDSRMSAVGPSSYSAPSVVLYSPDRTYNLTMQGDCNLVIYHNGVGTWSSNTSNGASNCFFAVQGDGNLVVYRGAGIPANAVWNSGTGGRASGAAYLQMGNDGIMHMYAGQIGSPTAELWHN
jgi:hypothetical protein